MSLVNYPGGLLIPAPRVRSLVYGTNFRTVTLDASGEQAAVVFQVPKTGDIRKIGFRTGTIAQMTNAFKVGLFTVDATNGNPTSTAYNNMVASTSTSPTANTWTWYTLATDANAVVKDWIAAKVEFNSFVAGDDVDVNLGVTLDNAVINRPYGNAFLSGSWTKQLYPPNIAIEYSDGSIEEINGCTAWASVVEETFGSATNPNRRGLRFKVPFNCRLSGLWVTGRISVDYNFVLYDTDGSTVLETQFLDGDIHKDTTAIVQVNLATKVILTKDTFYRWSVEAVTASAGRLQAFEVTDDGANKTMDAEPMGDFFHATTVDGAPTVEGDWTNTITKRYNMGIVVDQLDDGVGGSDIIISHKQLYR